mgnify:CR=1 FL=1
MIQEIINLAQLAIENNFVAGEVIIVNRGLII